MVPLVSLLSPSSSENFRRHRYTMEPQEQAATVDQEAATVESTEEAGTVPQDVPTVARPHQITLMYRPDTDPKLTDKFPLTPLHKRLPDAFLMGRGQNLDVMLNDEHMPRRFVEIWCRLDEDCVPKWFVKNLSDKKPVRLELNGQRLTVKHNEAKELLDGYKLKLEMLVLTVRIEDGDLVENAESELEFRPLDESSTGSSGSFHRQTSSSTDSSGSVSSATELARRAYGGSPAFGQNGVAVAVNRFGQVLPVGAPVHALGPVQTPGQFPQPGGLVYPVGGPVPGPGMAAAHPAGGSVVYYPPTCAASFSGVMSHVSAGGPHPPVCPHCRHHEGFQPYPNPQVCCHAGCTVQVNALPPHGHQQPGSGGHAAAAPSVGSAVGGLASAHPGVGGQALASSGLDPRHNAGFYSFHGGGHGLPASGSVPPGHSSAPAPKDGPHDQQAVGQPAGLHNPGAVPWVDSSAQRPQFPSLQSTNVKEPVPANSPESACQAVTEHRWTDQQSVSFQYPTLFTQEHHHNAQFYSSGASPSRQDQQSQVLLSNPLHGPLSMPHSQDWMASQNRQGLSSPAPGAAQTVVHAPPVITQPESAAVNARTVQQPQSAMAHNGHVQQPQSARMADGAVMHGVSIHHPGSAVAHNGQQPESAALHYSAQRGSASGHQPESAALHYSAQRGLAPGHQPESAALHYPAQRGSAPGHQPESAALHYPAQRGSAAGQQPAAHFPVPVTTNSRGPDNITSAPSFYCPPGGMPAAPPVTQLSGLTLGPPVQVTSSPFPTEAVSATPANSLSHPGPQGSIPALVSASSMAFAPQQMAAALQDQQIVNAEFPPAPVSSLTNPASNGNRIHLRGHEGISAPPPPSSDFSSQGSYRVQDLQQHAVRPGPRRRQPQEDDERRPEENDDQE